MGGGFAISSWCFRIFRAWSLKVLRSAWGLGLLGVCFLGGIMDVILGFGVFRISTFRASRVWEVFRVSGAGFQGFVGIQTCRFWGL